MNHSRVFFPAAVKGKLQILQIIFLRIRAIIYSNIRNNNNYFFQIFGATSRLISLLESYRKKRVNLLNKPLIMLMLELNPG